MHSLIRSILISSCTKEEKEKKLKSIEENLKIARNVLSGKFTYCPECEDYFLTESFLTRLTSTPGKICTYQDPINSGGNEYEDGMIETLYRICPKGHKEVIKRDERRIKHDTR